MFRKLIMGFLSLGLLYPPLQKAKGFEIFDRNISVQEVLEAQKTWCDALLTISNVFHKEGYEKAKRISSEIIDIAYGYDLGPVAFNPTWTYKKKNFRPTKRGALSYFVGGDPKFTQDPGFAIGSPEEKRSQWISCKVDNAVVQLLGGTANTMGNVTFKAKSGFSSTVDKTWSFIKTYDGQIKIILHESATPFK